jgi:anti-sigma28 factor (negative regulator of flagellin synthesis)
MQINSNLQSNSIASELGLGQSSSKNGAASSRQSGQDQVSISSLASQMTGDPSKLSQLQASYEAGTYNISPGRIAQSIMNDAMLG